MEDKARFYKIMILAMTGLIISVWGAGGFLLAVNAKEKEQPAAEDIEKVVSGNSKFTLELYSKLVEGDGNNNLFFSPYSISTALAMTYAGARVETEKQMAEVLRFGLPQERLHPAFGSLEKALNEQGKKGVFELTVANALWGQKGFRFLDSFIDLVNKNYDAGLNEVDFIKNTEGARQTINRWVEKKTKEKIKDIIKPGVLDAMTRLVLTNAIYFKGKWQYEFDKKDTKDTTFHITATKETKAPMMYIKKEFKYAERVDLQILELGYKGDALSMVVLLPEKVDGISQLEKELTIENLERWLGELRKREVIVYLPRFTFTSEFSLAKLLSAMGMKDAFSLPPADFSRMTGNKDLFISAILHKAFVEVNEEGTEAAAATAVVMTTTAMPKQPPTFKADRPFIFMIRDNKSGSILFMGKVCNPSEK